MLEDVESANENRIYSDDFDPQSVQKTLPSKYYTEPSAGELQDLPDTKILYNSNLMRLQISEVLTEIAIPSCILENVQKFISNLKTVITSLKETNLPKDTFLDSKWLPRLRNCSIKNKLPHSVTLVPPVAIFQCGSITDNSALLPNSLDDPFIVDLHIVISKSVFMSSDIKNIRYFILRAAFLDYIDKGLLSSTKISLASHIMITDGDYLRPYLIVAPEGVNDYLVRLIPVPESETFPVSVNGNTNDRIAALSHNRITRLADCHSVDIGKYLSSEIQKFDVYADALKLLKLWLRQRSISKRRNGFSSLHMKALLVWMIEQKLISNLMSPYQIFRSILAYIGLTSSVLQVSFCSSSSNNLKRDQSLNSLGEPMILWSDGIYNICSNVSSHTYEMMKLEAQISLDLLATGGFSDVFLARYCNDSYFDAFIRINDISNSSEEPTMDGCNLQISNANANLKALISQALGDRILFAIDLAPRIDLIKPDDCSSSQRCPITSEVNYGLVFSEHYDRVVDKCSSKETEFKTFWGELVQLRRFKDGTVCYAVYWPCNNFFEKQSVWTRIVREALKRCTSYSCNVTFAYDQLDLYVTGCEGDFKHFENRKNDQIKLINEFVVLLQNTYSNGFPLRIIEVKPVLDCRFRSSCPNLESNKSVELICRLEKSGKWPHHWSAVNRLLHALNANLCQILQKHDINCKLTRHNGNRSVFVSYKGLNFRIILIADVQITLTKIHQQSNVREQTNLSAEIIDLHKNLQVCSHLASVQYQHKLWHPFTCLCKRWMSTNLLLNEWSDLSIELICFKILECSENKKRSPRSILNLFIRFLTLIVEHKWSDEILFVNVIPECDEFKQIRNEFKSDRNSFPYATIASTLHHHHSSDDKSLSYFVAQSPSLPLLLHTVNRAKRTISVLKFNRLLLEDRATSTNQIKQCFAYPDLVWDVLIELSDEPLKTITNSSGSFEYVDFCPYDAFVRCLKDSYGKFALFLYDVYNPKEVVVVWKKSEFETQSLTASVASAGAGTLLGLPDQATEHTVSSRKRKYKDQSSQQMEYNPLQIIEQWKLMGLGLVKAIRIRPMNS